jgi:hypothetical protein
MILKNNVKRYLSCLPGLYEKVSSLSLINIMFAVSFGNTLYFIKENSFYSQFLETFYQE